MFQYDGPVEVSSDDLTSSESEDSESDDPNAVDEPPLDANDDCSEEEPEESFETGMLTGIFHLFSSPFSGFCNG